MSRSCQLFRLCSSTFTHRTHLNKRILNTHTWAHTLAHTHTYTCTHPHTHTLSHTHTHTGSDDDEDGSRRSGRRRKPKRDAYLEEEEREAARKAAALASGVCLNQGGENRVSGFASEARRASTRLSTHWGGSCWCITVRKSLSQICTD
jgi:hypothetical protein